MLCLIFRLLTVLGLAAATSASCSSSCAFPAIYNFGDSNSDTGGRSAAIAQVLPPYGKTTFNKPSGRLSDGRIILDFIAEKLGLPYTSAYLDSIGTNFEHGANFATEGMTPPCKSNIPKPSDFSKALYIFDIGQNDIGAGFQNMTEDQIRATFPNIMNRFHQAVQQLYNESGRAFWVHNTGPFGCLPYVAIPYMFKTGTLDQYGCAKPMNDIAQEFNLQLKNTVNQLRTQFPMAAFTYVDIYSAKFELISNAKHLGFDAPLNFCCASFSPYPVSCGTQVEVNGTVYSGTACDDPSRRINWDGIHYTEAANLWIAARSHSQWLIV